MSFILAGAAVVSAGVGVAKAIQGGVQAKRAKEDAKKAKAELEKSRNMFSSMDTSNPYQNMENTMEDLTVNTQAAEFARDQSMQSQANIMQGMRGAAGGSGIAALAQSMAQQGSMDAQKASASIGLQEEANRKLSSQEASKIQNKEREGEVLSRNMEMGKIDGLMGMASGDLAGARDRRKAGQEAMMDGIKDVANSGMDYMGNTGQLPEGSTYGSNTNTTVSN
jgi:hypothetical protein|tara:strand:- start:168 stop:836 length:669 start_codon:yes stop_codon:yes gene_type:complete